MSFKRLIPVLLLILAQSQDLSASSTTIDGNSLHEHTKNQTKPYLSVDAQIARYDILYSQNELTSKKDLFEKVVPGYGPIALEGVAYVRHYLRTDKVVSARCNILQTELEVRLKEKGGLTPVEFILYNAKLALSQFIGPCPVEDQADIGFMLEEGAWEKTPFYESKDIYLRSPSEKLIDYLLDESHGIIIKPYIIYTPNGGFKVSRMVSRFLHEDGQNLAALPIGPISLEKSPHGIFTRQAYTFFVHDLNHSITVSIALNSSRIKCLKELEPIKNVKPDDLLLNTFLFLLIHEEAYWDLSISDNPLFPKTVQGDFRRKILGNPSSSFSDHLNVYKEINEDSIKPLSREHSFAPLQGLLQTITGYPLIVSYSQPSNEKKIYIGEGCINCNTKKTAFRADFSCELQETGEILDETGLYEEVIVKSIDLYNTRLYRDERNVKTKIIPKIAASKDQRYSILTKKAYTIAFDGLIEMMYEVLGRTYDSTTVPLEEKRYHETEMQGAILAALIERYGKTVS